MSLVDELKREFNFLSVSVSSDIVIRCAELCDTYNLKPEDFVDQWFAYTASNLNGAPPTLEALDKLERKELKKLLDNVQKTPVSPVTQKKVVEVIEENVLEEYIASTIPSDNFSSRSDACSVQHTFGECNPESFKGRPRKSMLIKIVNGEMANSKYMYEKFLAKQGSLNAISSGVIYHILNHHKLELTYEKLKQYSGEMVICGRISAEIRGKLTPNSIQFEGLLEIYQGQKIKLSTTKLERMRLFSGQSAVLVGNNMKDWFTVKEIFTGAPLAQAPLPPLKENIQIMVAAGPFTLQENLLYEPLDQLLTYVTQFRPNVLILMGPFMDQSHPHFETLCESYDKFFENMVDGIMQRLNGITVVLVPSHKDIHNHVIFPSLPFKLKKRHENLYLAPNPFILDVDGLVIGGSTADVLFHLGKAECSKGAYEDRIGCLISHIFHQKSFYPLHPPDSDIRVDYQLVEEHGMLESAPHLMFLPSTFKHFVKVIEDCVVVNPERLTKGNGAGTFARIEVRPGENKISERVSCQIHRV